MNKKQQMQELLKATVDYYRADPKGRRSVTDDGDCMYTWGKNHCAIGRYLKPEYQREDWPDNGMSVWDLSEYSDNMTIDQFLIDKAHGLDLDFWRDLQDMHDIMGYWEEWDMTIDGKREYKLTDRGKENYVALQDRITKGIYDD